MVQQLHQDGLQLCGLEHGGCWLAARPMRTALTYTFTASVTLYCAVDANQQLHGDIRRQRRHRHDDLADRQCPDGSDGPTPSRGRATRLRAGIRQAGGGGTAYADGATYSFAADLTLFAQWTALANHKVIFMPTVVQERWQTK